MIPSGIITPQQVDPEFLALPRERLADAALAIASARGASYADFRLERLRRQQLVARDRALESAAASESTGYCVRVIHKGAWGFAAGVELTADAVSAAASRALDVAALLSPLRTEPVLLADEPCHVDTYLSAYDIDPFAVPEDTRIDFALGLTARALGSGRANHATTRITLISEQKFFASLAGSRITQQRIRVAGEVSATRVDTSTGASETMRTNVPPSGRGWEYLTSSALAEEAEALPLLLEEKMASPPVKAGAYDVVIHPSNLWLVLHESIGHATEFDRMLGHEANFAGVSYATPDALDRLRIGSPVVHITADRQTPHGLATTGYDDEGVAAQTWSLVRGGVLAGYQLNREMAHVQGAGRSNGCAFADGPLHAPLLRMPNVSLAPAPSPISLDDLINAVDDGIYIVGDRTWSIDMRRSSFQLTGQRFFRIRGGKLAGQVRDAAYRSTTPAFWSSLEGVGGPSTYMDCGVLNCGKGEPLQSAPATHGCPAVLIRRLDILNTAEV